jgi:protein-S-isoprenylcysteine O-methyltransferase Ste14
MSSSHTDSTRDFLDQWRRVARRIRVPLGFVTAALYLTDLWQSKPQMWAVIASLALVVPGLWLRGYASGYVKKNQELTQTGPYAYTRNPLYLGSMLMAAGFAFALLSWPIALVLAIGFTVIYVPVISSEERFLRKTFADFDAYCTRVPRLVPRLGAARPAGEAGRFSFELYLRHREYNAAIGAVLLYLSLFLLRPAFGAFLHLLR